MAERIHTDRPGTHHARSGRHRHDARLARLQARLARVQQACRTADVPGVVVFEGWDAAGKGGAIRRLSARMDPRGFKVWPIGPPAEYYRERHFLSRFMERLPPRGAIGVFDRSWYGRVLVERVEGLAPPHRLDAAHDEINDFERMITSEGVRLVKIFIDIPAEVQRARLASRLSEPSKRWKLSVDDFRNLALREAYGRAIDDMLARTDTSHAPWTVIDGTNKRHARIAALSLIARRLGEGLPIGPPPLPGDVLDMAAAELGLSRVEVTRIARES